MTPEGSPRVTATGTGCPGGDPGTSEPGRKDKIRSRQRPTLANHFNAAEASTQKRPAPSPGRSRAPSPHTAVQQPPCRPRLKGPRGGAGRGAMRMRLTTLPPPPRRQRCSVLTSDAQSPSNGRTSRGRQEPGSGGRIGASGAVSGAGAEGGSGSKVVPGGSGRLAVVRWTLGVARGTSALSACSDRAAAPRGRGDGGGQGYG